MTDVAAGFVEVALRLRRDWDVDVREMPDWRERGKPPFRRKLRGFVRHHTASARTGGRYAALKIVTNGRPGLVNALCHWYSPRGPGAELWLIAAGVAWHAGEGGWEGIEGNTPVVGLEAENDGRGEAWHADQLYAAMALDRVLADVFEWPVKNGSDHKEWAPSRKIDRAGIDGDAWRSQVATVLPPVKERPSVSTEEDDVFVRRQGTRTIYLVTPKGLLPVSAALFKAYGSPRDRVIDLPARHPLLEMPVLPPAAA